MWYFNNIGGLEVNREVLSEFLYSLEEEKKLTKFLKIIFKYKVLHDYNYISRIVVSKESVILDIYDNILENRFNRYIFDFENKNYIYNVDDKDDVFVTSICINNLTEDNIYGNNLLRVAYIFKLDTKNMIGYAKEIFTNDIVSILEKVIKK